MSYYSSALNFLSLHGIVFILEGKLSANIFRPAKIPNRQYSFSEIKMQSLHILSPCNCEVQGKASGAKR